MAQSLAIVLEEPKRLALRSLELDPPGPGDVVVETQFSGVSTGTERLFYTGRMPPFPGMGYPLVPGYETVGRVIESGPDALIALGTRVFVPGARCYGAVRGLHGGAASRLVTPASRVVPVSDALGDQAVLLALAATALHAANCASEPVGSHAKGVLIVGHGVLGRLLARLVVLRGGPAPVVWEKARARHSGARGYDVVAPEDDPRRDYGAIFDVSGDPDALDTLVARLHPGGEIILAGFYDRLSFAFPPRSCARREFASRRNGRNAIFSRSSTLSRAGAFARRIDHTPARLRRGGDSLPRGVRRSRLPKNGH